MSASSSVGVLPFIRGLDLTSNDLHTSFPDSSLKHMTGLRWLRLSDTHIQDLPSTLVHLKHLEHLTAKRNEVKTIDSNLAVLKCLRSLNLSRNEISNENVCDNLFVDNEELNTLDLSHNKLEEIPTGLSRCRSLLVLNLSHNELSVIPSTLLMALTDLLLLDLSHNNLDALPPQLRRLANLQTLDVSHNPLSHFQMRSLPSLTELRTLALRNTERTLANFPSNLESLKALSEVDLAENELSEIPISLYHLKNLKRLNLSSNKIKGRISDDIEAWAHLESLNLSRNAITCLPNSLCKLVKLRRLYVSENGLDFEGIPSGIGKLVALEIFAASDNSIEMIPESLCRCSSLKRLQLARNKLITLPDAIHLAELLELDLKGNENLVMPPKPVEMMRGSGVEFYNVDFSLQHQLRLAGASVPQAIADQRAQKDPVARKLRLRRRHRDGPSDADADQTKVLEGMQAVAKSKKNDSQLENSNGNNLNSSSIKAKKWDETLEKPLLDYSEFFDEDVGQLPGLSVWEIENFYPNQLDEKDHGHFYDGDCYIVLNTFMDTSGSLDWHIYFWIGSKATLDKCTCSAIHSVNLRNYLGAKCRTIREEQNDESDDFKALFHIHYIEGARTASGFYTVEDVEYTTRMYRIHDNPSSSGIHLEPVEASFRSLDPRFVFLVDAGLDVFVWVGKESKNILRSKARLLAEKINKIERKNKASIKICLQSQETNAFYRAIQDDEEENEEIDGSDGSYDEVENDNIDANNVTEPERHVSSNFVPIKPRLYQVGLGMGYLELPQVEVPRQKLKQELLQSSSVYILDCHSDLFVWMGQKSTRLVRAAALKLSSELFSMLSRPPFAMVHRVSEGSESQVFKSKFVGWDDVIAVDFTRTANSVQRTGADLQAWARKQDTKVDLSALFTQRQPQMDKNEALQLAQEWNEDLEKMEAFVLEGKKFIKLPEEEKGIFYSKDSYVYLCSYWVPSDNDPNTDSDPNADNNEDNEENDFQMVIVYFWQGREASNMGWLTFTFSLQKKFEALFGEKLEVVRMHQQQENLKFMSHFNQGLIIKQGSRRGATQTKTPNNVTNKNSNEEASTEAPAVSELYQIRCNGSTLCRRCIQIGLDASNLNSNFVFILKVPFDRIGTSGIVYIWNGSKSDEDDLRAAEEMVPKLYESDKYSLQTINEHEEPKNFFWVGVNGKRDYEEQADYMHYGRLFRCSNEKGYFVVSEKCSDFCQDDLAVDDIMILDTGHEVYIWMGPRCSEVEVKLSYKSAQVYIQNLRAKQPERPRKLLLTIMGKESKRFKRAFHAWSQPKVLPK